MSVDIVNLIESNPITKFTGDYQSKLVEKVNVKLLLEKKFIINNDFTPFLI